MLVCFHVIETSVLTCFCPLTTRCKLNIAFHMQIYDIAMSKEVVQKKILAYQKRNTRFKGSIIHNLLGVETTCVSFQLELSHAIPAHIPGVQYRSNENVFLCGCCTLCQFLWSLQHQQRRFLDAGRRVVK